MTSRLHVPYPVLSDADFELADTLDLPTFAVDGVRFSRRPTLIIRDGTIEHVFHPVFPPNESAARR